MATTANGTSVVLPNGTQKNIEGIVKIGLGSCDTQYSQGGGGVWTFMNGTEISMGVPGKSSNWYRIRWVDSINLSGAGGGGSALYRYTPSSGWVRVLDQGQHATMANGGYSDLYQVARADWWCPVHSSYPTESHSFRIYMQGWNAGSRVGQINIGRQINNGGQYGCNFVEVHELDVSTVNSGTYGRY
jgi:hypothetical protein